jgi:pyruvate formate-lyase activating enzyme-like uncharacterized protein
MIKILSIQEAYKIKIERQQSLPGLKYQSFGSCAYVGKDISPGCYSCFHSDAFNYGFMLGRDVGLADVCNRDCVYCFEPHHVGESAYIPDGWKATPEWKDQLRRTLSAEKFKITTQCKMQYYEFTGVCEPMLYLPVIKELMQFFRTEVDSFMGTRGWAKIYTNGTLLTLDNIFRLEEMGFDEVRIHPGASNFSSDVYANIRLAVKHIPTVTVETPAWPLHRRKLLEMLPVIQDIGVKHLDICQIELTNPRQIEKMEKALGEMAVYQAFYPMLDDGGLVEVLMREVIDKGYSYSVIDCNGFVKQSRSALSNQSYWSIFNRKYPLEWEKHRLERKL